MKVIICGGRRNRLNATHLSMLDCWLKHYNFTEVVSGGAPGIDSDGESWAKRMGLKIKRFPADWKAHGKAAGPIRNQQMAEYADYCAVFPGGAGTADMKRKAQAANITILEPVQK